jgi:hypothetical protein
LCLCSHRAVEVFGRKDRLVRVLAAQSASSWTGSTVLIR